MRWALPLLLLPVAPAPGADKAVPPVELRVRITAPRKDWDRAVWKVVLRTPTGIPIRESIGFAGDRMAFKKLPPGPYLVCIVGQGSRRSCQTVDATPPAGARGFRFDVDMETPRAELNSADLLVVSQHRLAVPRKAREELERADEALRQGDLDKAGAGARRALDIHADFVEALTMLGHYHHSRKEFDLAAEQHRRVTELDPKYYAGWLNLGGSLLARGQFEEALKAHCRAYELRSSELSVIAAVALDYFYLRRYEEAKRFFHQLVSLDPAHVNAPQIFLAQIAIVERDPNGARQHLQAYIDLHPNSPRVTELRAWMARLGSGTPAESLTLVSGP
jgi:cytochrome c-type biogenesis protein CcmH/NrfG